MDQRRKGVGGHKRWGEAYILVFDYNGANLKVTPADVKNVHKHRTNS
jgi:hypothetical protein